MCALISGEITLRGDTLRNLIPTKVPMPTLTPAAIAEIHNPTGTNENSNNNATNTITTIIINPIILSLLYDSISLTTTRVPSTSKMVTCLFLKINEPSETASILSLSNVIIPAGLKSVDVVAVFPTK